MSELKQIISHQANMKSLWLLNPTITEHILQSALRHLHAVIEGDELMAKEMKKVYWEKNANNFTKH
jgi:hypothetical protein